MSDIKEPFRSLLRRQIGDSFALCLLGLLVLLPAIGVGHLVVPAEFNSLMHRLRILMVMTGSMSAFLGVVQSLLLIRSFPVELWIVATSTVREYHITTNRDRNRLYVQIITSLAIFNLPIWGVALLPYYGSDDPNLLLKLIAAYTLAGIGLTIGSFMRGVSFAVLSVIPSAWFLSLARGRAREASRDQHAAADARCHNKPGPDMFRVDE